MNLLSSLLKYTADQIAALRAKDTSQDTTVSWINSRLITAEGDIDSLEAQFTTVVSAVTTDTEVTNIRVGDDGVTYDTAGNAVRKQFSDVKSDITDFIFKDVELESGTYNDYTVNKIPNNARVRCKDFIPTKGIKSITMPEGYQMWITCCGKNKQYLSVVGAWESTIDLSSLPSTVYYIVFGAKDVNNPTRDLSSDVAAIQSAMAVVTDYDRLNSLIIDKSEIIDSNTNDIEGLKKQSYVYEDVTSAFTVGTGQAYGTVGSHIATTSSQEYKHVRISKTDDVALVEFSTSYNPNISAYIQYVDDNDIIISRDFEQGSYNISSLYKYVPNFPTGATGMYVSAGWMTPSGFDNTLKIYEVIDYTFTDLYNYVNDQVYSDYNEIVKSVNRIADGLTVPQQSIIGYKTAYKLGFRAMLCDLRFTSDGVPVLFHDDYLNQYSNIVYDSNGQLVPTTNPIYIDQTSYEDLLEYDFGLYKGETYAHTPILLLEDMLNLCKLLGCEVWLEMKVNPTTAQFDTVFNLISKYGMRDKCYWAPQSRAQLSNLITYNPDVYINFHSNIASGETMTDEKVNAIVNATTDYNRYKNNITLSKTANITAAQVEALSEAGVGLMMTTMNTKNDVTTFYNRGVPYTCVTYALCTADVIAGKVLFETIQLN